LKVRKRTDSNTSQDWFQEEQLDKLRPLSSLFAGKLEPQKEEEIFAIQPKQTFGVFLSAGAAAASVAAAADDDDDDDDEKKKAFKFNETKIQLVSFLSLKVNRYTHLKINAVVLGEKANVILCFVSDLWNTFRGKSSSSVEKRYLFRPFHMEICIVIFTRIKSTRV
jgi:hypothetical protein